MSQQQKRFKVAMMLPFIFRIFCILVSAPFKMKWFLFYNEKKNVFEVEK